MRIYEDLSVNDCPVKRASSVFNVCLYCFYALLLNFTKKKIRILKIRTILEKVSKILIIIYLKVVDERDLFTAQMCRLFI